MLAFQRGRYAQSLCLALSFLLAVPAAAQNQTPPPATNAPATAQDTQTITVIGKKRASGDAAMAQISTTSAASCGFMNAYDPINDDITQDYLRDFNSDPSTMQPGGADRVDPNDPNAAGNRFNDTSPFGNASQDIPSKADGTTSSNLDSLTDGSKCTSADATFAAGRAYIARKDHSLKDAYDAFDAGDYPKAMELFKASYQKMDYDAAALMVGKMYLLGMGTSKDTAQAITWLKKVADGKFTPGDEQKFDANNPGYANEKSEAAVALGKVYMAGIGVPRDPKQAQSWYMKADKFGYIPATHIVGMMYEFGYGGEKNVVKAITYLKRAGTVGYTPSQYELGLIYYNGADGVPEDKKTAGAWMVLAAKGGNADALYACGRMYDFGEGGAAVDQQKAVVYYKEAAVKGQPDAQFALGTYFYTGEIVPKNLETARKLFEASAKQGNVDAMFSLGAMLARAEGGPADNALAYVWFKLADESGHEKAGAAVAQLEPKLTPADRAKADALLNPKPAAKP
jgi:TPR repeat protein